MLQRRLFSDILPAIFNLLDFFEGFMGVFVVSRFIGRVVFLTEATIRIVSGVLATMFFNQSCCSETGSKSQCCTC